MHQDITSPRKGAPWFFRTVLLYPLKSRTTFQCINALGGKPELKKKQFNKFGSFGDAKTAIICEIIANRNPVPCIQTRYLMYLGIFSTLFGFGVTVSQVKPGTFHVMCHLRGDPTDSPLIRGVRLAVWLLEFPFWG